MPKKTVDEQPAEALDINFEQAVLRLEEIVKGLENGDAPLNESLVLFEEGVRLTKHCNSLLDMAEQKVEIIGK